MEAVQRWKAITGEEEAAAQNDIDRAGELLADMVGEIAPVARLENEAHAAVAAAIKAEADRV